MGDTALHGVGQPADEAQFVEEVCHHDQGRKPDDGVPSAFFFQRVVPSQYAGQKAQAQAEEGGGGSVKLSRRTASREYPPTTAAEPGKYPA